MNVILQKNPSPRTIHTLSYGETFLFDGSAYMRIKAPDGIQMNAVELHTGITVWLSSSDPIIKLEGSFIQSNFTLEGTYPKAK